MFIFYLEFTSGFFPLRPNWVVEIQLRDLIRFHRFDTTEESGPLNFRVWKRGFIEIRGNAANKVRILVFDVENRVIMGYSHGDSVVFRINLKRT